MENRPVLPGYCSSLPASLMVVVYFYDVPKNPVGFFVDEASIAYNAHTIAQTGADEHGYRFPLYFRAFGGV